MFGGGEIFGRPGRLGRGGSSRDGGLWEFQLFVHILGGELCTIILTGAIVCIAFYSPLVSICRSSVCFALNRFSLVYVFIAIVFMLWLVLPYLTYHIYRCNRYTLVPRPPSAHTMLDYVQKS